MGKKPTISSSEFFKFRMVLFITLKMKLSCTYIFKVTDEDKAKAEVLKTEGNNAMKDQNFAEALEKYTKYVD